MLTPSTATVPWYSTFTAVTVDVSTPDNSSTSTTDSGTVTQTETAPSISTISIVSVTPEQSFPEDPTVNIAVSATTFTISGIYKNMMGVVHSWRDNEYVLQTSIVPPASGTYDKIIEVVSPALVPDGKPWNYIVESTFDQVVTATVFTTATSVLNDSTVTVSIPTIYATTLISKITNTVTNSVTSTTITTDTTFVSTSTWDASFALQRTYTQRNVLNITTSTRVEGTSTTATFIMKVTHTTYDTIRDKILDQLVAGQPETT